MFDDFRSSSIPGNKKHYSSGCWWYVLYYISVFQIINCELISFEFLVPTKIKYSDNNGQPFSLLITAISAGHCPGSVMFLLETKTHRILYTGDFRIRINALKKVICLKSPPLNEPQPIDAIYIDSTFFHRRYQEFPSQFESAAEIVRLTDEWLQKGDTYYILLKIPARYGSEFLYMECARQTGMKIHVNRAEYEKYRFIPEMDDAVTDNATGTRIHACVSSMERVQSMGLKCVEGDLSVMVIKPSAMVWGGWNKSKKIVERVNGMMYRVCYSSHASYAEIKEFLLYLKPKQVKLNVVPEHEERKAEMLNNLVEIMKEYQRLDNPAVEDIVEFNFENIKIRNGSINKLVMSDSDEDSKDEISQIPVKRTKL